MKLPWKRVTRANKVRKKYGRWNRQGFREHASVTGESVTGRLYLRVRKDFYVVVGIFVNVSLIVYAAPAKAGKYAFTVADLASMPRVCRSLSSGNFDSTAIKYRETARLPGQHTHHWCHGFKSLGRANRARDASDRNAELVTAAREFNYVISHSDQENPLLPSALYNVGRVKDRLGLSNEAISYYLKAINLKPGYLLAYASLSDSYKEVGDIEQARKTINRGLEYHPKSKALLRRLKQLDQAIKED